MELMEGSKETNSGATREPHNDNEGIDARDLLALQRTRLAVERTFLAFVRTGLAIFAAAVGVPYLFAGSGSLLAGCILGVVACAVIAWGVVRLRAGERLLELERRKLSS